MSSIMLEKIEIKWLKSSSSRNIAQVYDSGLEYCFVSDDMQQCHDFVYCKDFLQDAVQAFLNKGTADIYGFNYKPGTHPLICGQRTRIALANKSDKSFRDRIPNMLDFINQFAKRLHLKPTQAFEANAPPKKYAKCGVIITDGSERWMNSPPLLSMYSLFLRCGCAHTVGTDCMETVRGIVKGKVKGYQNEDSMQLGSAIVGIEKLVTLGYRPFFYTDNAKNYPDSVDIDTMHESGGIVGFSSGYSRDICRYWHRKSLAKRLEVKK